MTENQSTESVQVVEHQVQMPTQAEKLLSQSEVNELIGHAKIREREKAQAELASKGPALTAEEFRKIAREEAASVQYEQTQKYHADQLANSLYAKAQIGVQKYPDFEQKVAALGLIESPLLLAELGKYDTADEIMYELGNHPQKFAAIAQALKETPTAGKAMMANLAKSINANKDAAAKTAVAAEPLSQLKPSAIKGDGGKAMSVSEFRNMDFARY